MLIDIILYVVSGPGECNRASTQFARGCQEDIIALRGTITVHIIKHR